MNKKHIKLYENFDLNDDSYTEIIDKNVYQRVSVYNSPEETSQWGDSIDSDSEIELNRVVVKFNLDINYKRSGIEDITFRLISIALDGSIIDYDGNEIENFDIVDDDISYEKYETQMGTFPLYLGDIEINMNKTFDTSKWKYEIAIGNFR
tara:strand:- start:24998 stop:25447 length:450 start_codon:yes stop_codon:yes gene_type:complete